MTSTIRTFKIPNYKKQKQGGLHSSVRNQALSISALLPLVLTSFSSWWHDGYSCSRETWQHPGKEDEQFFCVCFSDLKNTFTEVLLANLSLCLLMSYWSGVDHVAIFPVTANITEILQLSASHLLEWSGCWEAHGTDHYSSVLLSVTGCICFSCILIFKI